MSKFCSNCGFENNEDAHFCVECGSPLSENTPTEYKSKQKIPFKYSDFRILDIGNCILCKSHNFYHLQKESLLGDKNLYYCSECGLNLEKHGAKFKLTDINDKNTRIWQMYNHQTLSVDEWVNIGNGGLSDRDQEKVDMDHALQIQQELQLHFQDDLAIFVNKLSTGAISFNNVNTSLILKKDENVLLDIGNVNLNEPRAVRVSQSGGIGTSVRVAKGVSVHSGSGQSRSVSHDEIMNVDTGHLIITNKRLVFTGSKKTVTIDLKKILTITAYKDGISVQRENKQKVEYFVGTNKSNLTFTIDGRHQSTPLEGYIVKAAILGQISNL